MKQYREIPYNYTSFSDQQIVEQLLDAKAWQNIVELRTERVTGRSARMLFEILGDMWVVERNPYIQTDLLMNPKRWQSLAHAFEHRLQQISARAKHPQVVSLVQQTRHRITQFNQQLLSQRQLRQRCLKKFAKFTRTDNICFDGISRVAHATDATDWRVEYPFVVLKPDAEAEILPLIKTCIALDLKVIVRGGGTGYTGAAIPLQKNVVVINTEKLQQISQIQAKKLPGVEKPVMTIHTQAGVVTRRVSDAAKQQGLVFAVDPTSQDASTIGGNIAMNAGGKKAVLWGTTLDNLASWRMITADCQLIEVQRIGHNLGKVHDQDTAEFLVNTLGAKNQVEKSHRISVPGKQLRKTGLGKDVTDKFLAGIPGIQKEGCDGFILSAEFVLHKPPAHIRTLCLEFYGHQLHSAVNMIVELNQYLAKTPTVQLAGLEHMDRRYLKAVGYSSKAARDSLPKMILLADIVGDDEQQLSQAASEIVRMTNQHDGEGFIAVGQQARQRFWLDRAKTAAIAAHTNAFKINEDVVIPLKNLANYSDEIERINIEYSLRNKIAISQQLQQYFQTLNGEKQQAALALIENVQQQWQDYFQGLQDAQTFSAIQSQQIIISYRQQLEKPLKALFTGDDYRKVRAAIDAIHQQFLSKRLFVALHMHAGDGNVHTNIPVNSHDQDMLQQADDIVARVMQLARDLEGVISGEHGIGITKMAYIDDDIINAFSDYKQQIDPKDIFNPGKLQPGSGLQRAYTPSFRLLEQEALILEASSLGELNNSIKDCLRCGKCKPVCMTHVPTANLYYSPRDKILATGSLIEAFLYEEQTRRGISTAHFHEFNDIADHCTTCHHCKNPCPVDIDFGEVTIAMRHMLQQRGQRKTNIGSKLAMAFLNISNPFVIKSMRKLLMQWGFSAQRVLHKLFCKLPHKTKPAARTTGKATMVEQAIHFVRRPLPKAIPSKTTRALINAEDDKTIAIIRDAKKITETSDAVFYFPGCGSERLFSQVGLATLAMLYRTGVQTVLPPGYLCCGYPQTAVGDKQRGEQMSVNNRVLFHRMANTLNYLDIKTVLVSCGTCIDQLGHYQFDKIFPGSRLMDIHEYLFEKGVQAQAQNNTHYLYHDPCHSPMKIHSPTQITSQLLQQPVTQSKFCCGDAGTLSMSRPDIGEQLKSRKQAEIQRSIERLPNDADAVKILTSCPACLKGLSAYENSTGVKADYVVVELANRLLGKQWQTEFVQQINQGGVEKVLL